MHCTKTLVALLLAGIVHAKHVWTDVKRPEMVYLSFPGHASHVLATSLRELAGKWILEYCLPLSFVLFLLCKEIDLLECDLLQVNVFSQHGYMFSEYFTYA